MTAPPRQRKRPTPARNRPPRENTLYPQYTDAADVDRDVDRDLDRQLVDGLDGSLWAAIFDGHFRLAVRCDRCGRWLTAGRSKRAHLGPRCAQKVADR